MKRYFIPAVALALAASTCAFVPGAPAQQTARKPSDLMIRVSGPANVAEGESLGTVWVIGNNATIAGKVHELVVVNGSAQITGTVAGNFVLVNGTATLGPASRIGKDILLYRSSISRAPGAAVVGAVHSETGLSFRARTLWLLWLSVTVGMIAAGFVFAWVAGPQLQSVADSMRTEWRGVVVTALILLFGLPVAAVVSFMTGIGVVFGLFILFVLIPLLAFVGYVIAGMSLGRSVMGITMADDRKLYRAIALGLLMIQVASVIPAVGGIVLLAGSQLGAGALVYRTWKRTQADRARSGIVIQPAWQQR